MSLLSRNVELGPALKISSWRKIAIGTWRTAGDPSVYGILDYDVGPALDYLEEHKKTSDIRLTLTHFVGRAVAETLARHPEINCILRFGKLYPRKNVDIFFQVASDMAGKDLSGMVVRSAHKKTMGDIAREMEETIQAIRKKGDPAFQRMKGTFGLLPGLLAGPVLTLSGFLMYSLNLWSSLLGTPKDPFGSVMITNVGSLGLETAFAPLVPYSRVPILLAVGATRDMPIAREGKVVVAKMIRICATFDHRLIDGVQAARMSRTMEKIFANPKKELGT